MIFLSVELMNRMRHSPASRGVEIRFRRPAVYRPSFHRQASNQGLDQRDPSPSTQIEKRIAFRGRGAGGAIAQIGQKL